MNTMPVHPAIVHLPLGLAILMPLVATAFAVALWRGRIRVGGWLLVCGLQALLIGAGTAALQTGHVEEALVEGVVQEAALEQHEEAAEQFLWVAVATLALALLVAVVRQRTVSRLLAASFVAATLVVSGAAWRVGHAGGALVYRHGAANAYWSAGGGVQASVGRPAAGERGDEEHERGEHRR